MSLSKEHTLTVTTEAGSTGSGNIGFLELGTAHEDVDLFYFIFIVPGLPMIYILICIITRRIRNKLLSHFEIKIDNDNNDDETDLVVFHRMKQPVSHTAEVYV